MLDRVDQEDRRRGGFAVLPDPAVLPGPGKCSVEQWDAYTLKEGRRYRREVTLPEKACQLLVQYYPGVILPAQLRNWALGLRTMELGAKVTLKITKRRKKASAEETLLEYPRDMPLRRFIETYNEQVVGFAGYKIHKGRPGQLYRFKVKQEPSARGSRRRLRWIDPSDTPNSLGLRDGSILEQHKAWPPQTARRSGVVFHPLPADDVAE